MAIAKVIYKSSPSDTGTTWMDVTAKTVTAASMRNGVTALKNDGTDITGNIADMTLPTAASASSSGTAKATITPGSSAQYLNIPAGYNGTAVYYTISAAGGGGGGLTQIASYSFGSFSGSATSATDTGKSMTLASSTGWSNYDLLLVDCSVDTLTNGRHTSTVSMVIITHQTTYGTPSNYAVAGNKWNSKLNSSGTASTRQSTTAYGIYANSATVSSGTMTIPFYYRQNSNNTGTINGTYTVRVYGVKLFDLIGG